jgi:hypothetical protein
MSTGGSGRGQYGERRRATTAITTRTTSTAGTARAGPVSVTEPPGRLAAQRATAMRARRNGSARRQARVAAHGATGAVAAAITPSSIGPPASGRPSRLAGRPARDTGPRARARAGTAAAWAPRVMPAALRTRSGTRSGSALARAGPSQSTPAVAATESWNPRAPASPGSASSSTTTARQRARRPPGPRPVATPSRTRPAMTPARSTLGSQRVTTTSRTTSTIPTTARTRRPAPPTPASHSPAARTTARLAQLYNSSTCTRR